MSNIQSSGGVVGETLGALLDSYVAFIPATGAVVQTLTTVPIAAAAGADSMNVYNNSKGTFLRGVITTITGSPIGGNRTFLIAPKGTFNFTFVEKDPISSVTIEPVTLGVTGSAAVAASAALLVAPGEAFHAVVSFFEM